jgi:hypothetical protein
MLSAGAIDLIGRRAMTERERQPAEPAVNTELEALATSRERQPAEPAVNTELEALATSVELTIASVLQGIALAILIPQIVGLITSGAIAKLPYIPASLLLIFIVWIAFISHAISFITWPFNLAHNLLYFLVVTSEAVLLTFLDRPAPWFLSLTGFGIVMGLSYWYNLRSLRRYERRYATPAAQALYAHLVYDQRASLGFMAGYILLGLFGYVALQLRPEFGLPQELGWAVTGMIAMVLPAIHVAWQFRLLAGRTKLIERVKRDDVVV